MARSLVRGESNSDVLKSLESMEMNLQMVEQYVERINVIMGELRTQQKNLQAYLSV